MELILNLVWALLAVVIVSVGLRQAPGAGAGRRTQFVALALLTLILFPVISVTDDLQAMQNPAEADSCVRRDQISTSGHCLIPALAALPEPSFSGISFGFLRMPAPGNLQAPLRDHPALTSIQNRPPPVA